MSSTMFPLALPSSEPRPEAMLATPMIDVLMPVRNGQRHVRAAITSTLTALRGRGRVLVMDDGSTDATPGILRQLADSNHGAVVVHRNTHSRGVAYSLNQLLSRSSSRLVARMDADDICLPWRFDHQISQISDHAEILFGGYLRFGTASGLLRQPLPLSVSGRVSGYLLQWENPFCHPTLICTADVLRSIGGYQFGLAEDYLTWVRAAAAGVSLRRTRVPVVLYRTSAGQTSGSSDWRHRAMDEVHQSEWRRQLLEIDLEHAPLSTEERIMIRRVRKRRGAR